MTDRREHIEPSPSIDGQLAAIRMTPSERAEARHALELATRAARLIMATTSGLKWLVRVPVSRRAGRKAAPTARRTGGAPAAQASTVLRRDPQSAN